ncbi:hypothetical protein [Polaribacter sp. Hel_I_88]|uniref:hypothetical protein n=1 Tax=Polaribacter sp. Hel_I_88 TaxID=1250006 RepID=UPI00047968FF|nr:hypothetical protein [Polaribacter sp. Hel_I_88]
MKSFQLTLIIILFFNVQLAAQESQDPSLSVGLESLTFGKGTIDVDALRKVLVRKQNELKREGLKRFVFKKLPNYHYTTKLFLQNSITTLIDEKNQNIIEKELLELSTNYSLIIGFANIYEQIYYKEKKDATITKYYDSIKPEISKKLKKQFLIDIIGTSLSNNKLLKSRGFFDFDSKIDFKASKFYEDNFESIKNAKVKKSDSIVLIDLKQSIDNVVTSYLNSYKYVKNILKNKDYTKLKNIKDLYLNESKTVLNNQDNLFEQLAKHNKDSKFINAVEVSVKISQVLSQIKLYNEKFNEVNNVLNESISPIEKFENYTGNHQDYLRTNLESTKKIVENYHDYLPDLKIKIDTIYYLIKEINKKTTDTIQNKNILSSLKAQVGVFKNLYEEDFTFNADLKKYYTSITSQLQEIRKQDSITYDTVVWYNENVTNKINEFKLKSFTRKLNKIDISALNTFKNVFNVYQEELKELAIKDLSFLKQIMGNVSKEIISENFNKNDSLFLKNNVDFFADLYIKTKKLSEKDELKIDDVLYFEEDVLPQLIKAKLFVTDSANDAIIDKIIKATDGIIPLMKYYLTPKELNHLELNQDIISFFEFISNIDRLDKANTFSFILQLLDQSHNFIVSTMDSKDDNLQKFRRIYEKLLNGIEKYTIVNSEEEIIEIDILSFLNTFVEQYNRENDYGRHSIYFTIGIGQNVLLKKYKYESDGVTNYISSIGFASEKLGYKLKIKSFKNSDYTKNMATSIINKDDLKNQPNPFINQWYATVYGSGLLYKLANLTTDQNFDFSHIGFATGLRFYNSLDLNFSIGFPFIENQKFGNNAFLGISMDIPIGEYISAIGTGKQ